MPPPLNSTKPTKPADEALLKCTVASRLPCRSQGSNKALQPLESNLVFTGGQEATKRRKHPWLPPNVIALHQNSSVAQHSLVLCACNCRHRGPDLESLLEFSFWFLQTSDVHAFALGTRLFVTAFSSAFDARF